MEVFPAIVYFVDRLALVVGSGLCFLLGTTAEVDEGDR
jgi:hypothetical protein